MEAARRFGEIMASEGVGLVYGGGSRGLMGAVASSVLDHGGHVTGIIPGFLTEKESSDMATAELSDLAEASLQVMYRQPGGFCCRVLSGVGRPRIRFPVEQMLRVREGTREAALQVARRIDPQVEAAQIVPAELAVTVEYLWGGPRTTLNGLALHATADGASYHFLRKTTDRAELPVPR